MKTKKTARKNQGKKSTIRLAEELLTELRKDTGYTKFEDLRILEKEVGEEIRKARTRRRMSVEDLAVLIQKSPEIVRRMEKGEFKQYTLRLLLEIAQALRCRLKTQIADR